MQKSDFTNYVTDTEQNKEVFKYIQPGKLSIYMFDLKCVDVYLINDSKLSDIYCVVQRS